MHTKSLVLFWLLFSLFMVVRKVICWGFNASTSPCPWVTNKRLSFALLRNWDFEFILLLCHNLALKILVSFDSLNSISGNYIYLWLYQCEIENTCKRNRKELARWMIIKGQQDEETEETRRKVTEMIYCGIWAGEGRKWKYEKAYQESKSWQEVLIKPSQKLCNFSSILCPAVAHRVNCSLPYSHTHTGQHIPLSRLNLPLFPVLGLSLEALSDS